MNIKGLFLTNLSDLFYLFLLIISSNGFVLLPQFYWIGTMTYANLKLEINSTQLIFSLLHYYQVSRGPRLRH